MDESVCDDGDGEYWGEVRGCKKDELTDRQVHANERQIGQARGRMVGGSSAMNFSCTVYPNASNFDDFILKNGRFSGLELTTKNGDPRETNGSKDTHLDDEVAKQQSLKRLDRALLALGPAQSKNEEEIARIDREETSLREQLDALLEKRKIAEEAKMDMENFRSVCYIT